MNDISEWVSAVERIDDELVSLLNRRFALTAQAAEDGTLLDTPEHQRTTYARALAATPAAERDTVYGVFEKIFAGSCGTIETIARGVAIKDGRVLLCQGRGAQSTYLPGGHIDFGETAREALVREIKEELGLDATAGEFLGVLENSFLQHGKRHCEINLVYRLDLATTKVTSQEDWISFSWCPLDRLADANLLPVDIRALCRA